MVCERDLLDEDDVHCLKAAAQPGGEKSILETHLTNVAESI